MLALTLTDTASTLAGVLLASAVELKAETGILYCNGQEVLRATYPILYGTIGDLYGAGDGTTTFNVPDLRGMYMRGVDLSRGVDPDRMLASTQTPLTGPPVNAFVSISTGNHQHGTTTIPANSWSHKHVQGMLLDGGINAVYGDVQTGSAGTRRYGGHSGAFNRRSRTSTHGAHTHTATAASNGAHTHTATNTGWDAETRPHNTMLKFYISTGGD